jgi:plastocyanin
MATLGLAACGSSNGSGPQVRTVQVDHKYDQFATAMLNYFPRVVAVRPGDTVRFKQTWTGEPHTVTLGTIIDNDIRPFGQLLDDVLDGKVPPPDQPPAAAQVFEDGSLPSLFSQNLNGVSQLGAQPCYLDSGNPPRDETKPCPKRAQPAFNGRQSYYSSGFIHYQGLNGNSYDVKLADDIQPGRYRYYCTVHGPLMSGVIDVKAKGTKIASQGAVDQQAQKEIDRRIAPAIKVVNQIKAGKGDPPGNLAGAGPNLQNLSINQFFPTTITTKVNEKVTWTMVNSHTISFNAPKYFPIVSIGKDGAIIPNDKIDRPAGWTIPDPAQSSPNGPPPPPRDIDLGTWNGKGFYSTGSNFNTGDKITVRFSKPGTYLYACLIHPPMVGKVVVK